jgi:hypothetical protein
VFGLVVRVKLKSGAVGVSEVVVLELAVLDALEEVEEVAAVPEDVEVLDDEIVLTEEVLCPDFGKEIPIAPPTTTTMITKTARAVLPIAGRSFLRNTILPASRLGRRT